MYGDGLLSCREFYWANYATGLGASLHELGHTFDLCHTSTGIMARGFDDIHRTFVLHSSAMSDSSSAVSSASSSCSSSAASSPSPYQTRFSPFCGVRMVIDYQCNDFVIKLAIDFINLGLCLGRQ
jgi:hypothetical protein